MVLGPPNSKTPGVETILTTIKTKSDLDVAVKRLCGEFPDMAAIMEGINDVPLRARAPGFAGLAEIIVSQQVSKASATAIFGRLTTLVQPFNAATFLAAGEGPQIEAGLSRAKQVTLDGLATALIGGNLDLDDLCAMPAEEAIDRLTALKGIGPWTAEVFLLFCAGHCDIFPAGDVALQHAVGWVCGCATKPDTRQTRVLSEQWRPLRGVAARVLYAHYAIKRGTQAAPV